MKEAYYFSHDSNAHRDPKIIQLRMDLGWEGYGIFWAIIEILRESTDYTAPTDYNLIGYDLRADAKAIKDVVENYGLFALTPDGKHFYSERLKDSMAAKGDLSNKRSQAASKRWEKEQKQTEYQKDNNINTNNDNTSDEQKQCKCNANAMQVQCIIKEKKGKEKKEDIEKESTKEKTPKRPAFVPPTHQELQTYIEEKNFKHVDPERFIDYYTSNGWKVGKNPMKDWKATARNWEKENKQRHDNTHNTAATSRRGHVLTNGQNKDWDAGF